MILEIWGTEGTGKNYLALTAAEVRPPVTLFAFDGNEEVALKTFERIYPELFKQVTVLRFPEVYKSVLGGINKAKATRNFAWFGAEIDKAMTTKGTIIFDTGDQVWHLVRTVKLEGFAEGEEVAPKDHDQANSVMDGLLYNLQLGDILGIFLHKAEHPWEGGMKSGGYVQSKWVRAKTYKEFGYKMRLSVFLDKPNIFQPTEEQVKAARDRKLPLPKAVVTYRSYIYECKDNQELNDKPITNPTVKKILGMVYP